MAATTLRELPAAYELFAAAAHRQVANDLQALGAPEDLVVRSLAAAVDEHDHVARQLAIHGGDETWWSPPSLPTAVLPLGAGRAIACLAAEAYIDGMVGEAAAARAMSRAADLCRDPDIRTHLLVMAADEERHASLAGDIVLWALRESRATAAALRSARRSIIQLPLAADGPNGRPVSALLTRLDRVLAWGCALDEADVAVQSLKITAEWSEDLVVDHFHLASLPERF